MSHQNVGCFLIGVTGPGFSIRGDALLGSVSDDPYDVRTFLKAVYPENSLSHIGTELISTTEHTLTDRGYFARPGETTRGINESGLAFTCAMVLEDETIERTLKLTPYADITEKMMKACRTVADAIDLFQSAKAVTPAYSVLLADAKGDLAHLEVGNFGINVNHHYTHENPGAVFAVNCYLSQCLVNYNAPHTLITDPENNNQARRERGKALAQKLKGEFDPASLAILLSDHANRDRDPTKNPLLAAWGYSICNHGTRSQDTYPKEDLPWGTVSAEILQPSEKSFWYAYGWPCGQEPEHGDQIFQENSWGKFIPFTFPSHPSNKTEISKLSTPEGEITKPGFHFQKNLPVK